MKKTIRAKRMMIATTALTLMLAAAGVVNYIKTGIWDAQLSCVISCATVACVLASDEYTKHKKENEQ